MRHTTNGSHDADDLFAETRMSFGDHIEELRYYLIRAVVGFAIGMVASLAIAKPVLNVISAPVEREPFKYYERTAEQRMEEARKLSRGENDLPPLVLNLNVPTRPFVAAVAKELNLPGPKEPLLEPLEEGFA